MFLPTYTCGFFPEEIEGIYSSITEIKEPIDMINTASNPDSSSSKDQDSTADITYINDSDIKKSTIIDLDSLTGDARWREDLNLIKQIAFTMLLGNSLILSIVVNILFIQFGEKFISRFKLEERFPKIKKILEYRRKFKKFYMLNGAFLIIVSTSASITFAISILIS